MGIPGFSLWFYENNKQAYVPLQQVQTDHLYIDLNSVLHNVLRRADNYDRFHATLHQRLDAILRATQPRKSVMLAIDGPAPLAKLITQRERRKKSFSTEERQKQHAHKHGSKKAHKAAKVVSSTALTPGTPFMHDVCVSCSYYVCARLAQRKWQNVEFEVSGPTVAGEGEVKILGRLARPRHLAAVSPTDTHVIVGDDADLVLMALVSTTLRLHILNVALSDNRLNSKTAVLSVDNLHALWLIAGIAGPAPAGTAYGNKTSAAAAGSTKQPRASKWDMPAGPQQQQLEQLSHIVLLHLLGAKADLAMLAIMSSGNDYLPGLAHGHNIDTLWSCYKALRQLPEFAGRSIITRTNHSGYAAGSQRSNSNGNSHHQSSTNANGSSSSSSGGQSLAVEAELDPGMLAELLAMASEGQKSYMAKRKSAQQGKLQAKQQQQGQDSSSTGGSVLLNEAAKQAVPWLKGLLWNMTMYFAGNCPDYRWCYKGGSPACSGLQSLVATIAAAAVADSTGGASHTAAAQPRVQLGSFLISSSSQSSGSIPAWQRAVAAAAAAAGDIRNHSTAPLLPHVCSLALLPGGAQEHVPAAMQHLMDEASPIADMYAICEECEAAATAVSEAQRAYSTVLTEANTVEAQMVAAQRQLQQLKAQQQQDDQQQQQQRHQQQLDQLLAKQKEVLAYKATALAAMHAAIQQRKKHQMKAHPDGLDIFDLARLEAAVASVPQSGYAKEQKALTQLSNSMLFRLVDTSAKGQAQFNGPRSNSHSSNSFGDWQSTGFKQQHPLPAVGRPGLGRYFRPPPPPVKRFGPALLQDGPFRNLAVARTILLETPYECKEQEAQDLWRYSAYMVVGTEAAAAAADEAATGAANQAAAAQLKLLLRQNKQQWQQPQQPAEPTSQQGMANAAAAAAAAAALAAHQQEVTEHQPQQQQQQQHRRSRSKSPMGHRGQQQYQHAAKQQRQAQQRQSRQQQGAHVVTAALDESAVVGHGKTVATMHYALGATPPPNHSMCLCLACC